MKKMFGSMMQEFFSAMSEKDKQAGESCLEKMTAMCPCLSTGDRTDSDKKTMMDKMKSCCGGKMEMMSAFSRKMEEKVRAERTSGKA